MLNRARIAVLVSGGGTNLQALLDAQRAGALPHGEICVVISSRAEAYALRRGEAAGVPGYVVSRRECGSQQTFEDGISALLTQYDIDLIILAGFMSILSAAFTTRWPRRILNVHPSLIPSFCGAPVHVVHELPDRGEILLPKAVEIRPDDTPQTLQRRVMEQAEWQLLPQAAEMVAAQIIKEREK